MDDSGNKIIEISPIFADNHAHNFKYLHSRTLHELYESGEVEDIIVGRAEYSVSIPIFHLVIQYKDLLKANVIFSFSKELNNQVKDINEDKEYLLSCHFFYWEDEYGKGKIRIVKPLSFR